MTTQQQQHKRGRDWADETAKVVAAFYWGEDESNWTDVAKQRHARLVDLLRQRLPDPPKDEAKGDEDAMAEKCSEEFVVPYGIFRCSNPRGHVGDHVSRDASGIELKRWLQQPQAKAEQDKAEDTMKMSDWIIKSVQEVSKRLSLNDGQLDDVEAEKIIKKHYKEYLNEPSAEPPTREELAAEAYAIRYQIADKEAAKLEMLLVQDCGRWLLVGQTLFDQGRAFERGLWEKEVARLNARIAELEAAKPAGPSSLDNLLNHCLRVRDANPLAELKRFVELVNAAEAERDREETKLTAPPAATSEASESQEKTVGERMSERMVKYNPSYAGTVSLFHFTTGYNHSDFRHATATTLSEARNAIADAIDLAISDARIIAAMKARGEEKAKAQPMAEMLRRAAKWVCPPDAHRLTDVADAWEKGAGKP